MGLLSGKVAVITGSSRGLGFAIAESYAAAGAAVVLSSRSKADVYAAVQQLVARGWKASGIPTDVSYLTQIESLAAHAIQAFGHLDIWVNNAGVAGPYGPTMGFTPDAFYQIVQTNIIGVYHGSRTAMKYFLRQRSGKLVNVLGHGYKGPVTWQNAYASSKAWVRSFTRSLAEETRGSGVGVYAFNPGMVLTELLTDVEVIAGYEDKLKRFPMVVRMLAKPADVPAQKALWLASPATDGMTGLEVSVSSMGSVLVDVLRMGIDSLFHRPAPQVDLRVKVIPPADISH